MLLCKSDATTKLGEAPLARRGGRVVVHVAEKQLKPGKPLGVLGFRRSCTVSRESCQHSMKR